MHKKIWQFKQKLPTYLFIDIFKKHSANQNIYVDFQKNVMWLNLEDAK